MMMVRRGCCGSGTLGSVPVGISQWQWCRRIRCWKIRVRSSQGHLGLSSVYTMDTAGQMRRATFVTIFSGTSEICSVDLSLIELHHIRPVLSNTVCGHPVCETCDGVVECSFCHLTCEGELMQCFHLEITVADGSLSVFTWSTGQTASELLQISPDEFYELPEDEQAMYLYTLKNERFMIAIVHSLQKPDGCFVSSSKEDYPVWEITRAQKCD